MLSKFLAQPVLCRISYPPLQLLPSATMAIMVVNNISSGVAYTFSRTSSHKRLQFKQIQRLQSSCSCQVQANKCKNSVPSHNLQFKRDKPMCLYHSQNMCKMMDDPQHMEKFNHSYTRLNMEEYDIKKLQPQQVDYFLVLDLEGKVEILEFPVVMIDAHSLDFVDAFHRFVRPIGMSNRRIEEYIEGKYGKMRLDRVWHDTAIPFDKTLQHFEMWLERHQLWEEGMSTLNRAAFVTCGNWDVKTKIPQQCQVSRLKLPSYFMEWINIKDIYLNFYNSRAAGMMAMLKGLNMPIFGSHHVGLDDAQNIARVLQRMLADGALMQITARRIGSGPEVIHGTQKSENKARYIYDVYLGWIVRK